MVKRRKVDSDTEYDLYSNCDWSFATGECDTDLDSDMESDLEDGLAWQDCNESESDSDSEIDVEEYVKSFSFKLRKWAVNYNITLMALSFLLKLLQEQGFKSLPKDARTLLQTPRTVEITRIGDGEYWYRSLKQKLTEICKKFKCPTLLELGIHIDGIPPFVGSKLEFWPIQCWIKDIPMRPFFVGLHFGNFEYLPPITKSGV